MMTLTTFSALARILTADDPLTVQIPRCLHILETDLPDLRLRMTVWEDRAPRIWALPDIAWNDRRRRQVAQNRKPLIEDAPVEATAFNDLEESSYMGLPIVWEGRLWGILEAERRGQFTVGERTLLVSLIPLLAAAIGEAQLGRVSALPAPEQPAQRAVAQLAQHLEAPLSVPELLNVVLREAIHAIKASAGAISLIDHEREEYTLTASEGFEPPPGQFNDGRHTWPFTVGIVGRVARTGKATILTDTSHDAAWEALRPDVRSELIVPIRIDHTVAAVLVLSSSRDPVFNTSDLHLAQVIADLTSRPLQRALAYQELSMARTQLQQTLASLPLGLALIEQDGRILRTNPAWYRLWHVEPPSNENQYLPWDLLPLLLKRLSHPLELTDFFAECQAHPEKTFELALRLLEPDQDLRLRATPVLASNNEANGRLIVIEDVTREREIDKMKNEFVSVVSHELRTPLTSILGYTELLLNRDFRPVERQEFIQTVYDQANQLSKMVDDLLNLSRLDAGQIKLSRWVVSLNQLAYEITKQLNESLSRKHRLLIDVPPALPPIFADKEKIRQIISNLLSNAIKYSPDGGQVALVARELRQPPPGAPPLPPERQMLIAVIDQGIGISPEDLPNIFNRFFRVDNSMTRKIGGTGLGLSITKALVELHGGRIWVTSDHNKGTTFWLTLPIANDLTRRGS